MHLDQQVAGSIVALPTLRERVGRDRACIITARVATVQREEGYSTIYNLHT